MRNKEEILSVLNELRADSAESQKRGLHFIIASVFIWAVILVIHVSPLTISSKNLFTFFSSALLMPLACLFSKLLGIDFRNESNPLSRLGLLFAVNQMLYILIAMWVYASMPSKMLMVYAMIFGAHLLPYGWLYQSKSYYSLSAFIPVAVLAIGLCFSAVVLAVFMLIIEVIFCFCLIAENKRGKCSR